VPARLFAKKMQFLCGGPTDGRIGGHMFNIESGSVLPVSIDAKRALIVKSGCVASLGHSVVKCRNACARIAETN
jgi:hypothetical protein